MYAFFDRGRSARAVELWLLLLAGAAKLALLATYGPLIQPDSGNYLWISETILQGQSAFSRIPDWATSAMPALAFRAYGYPLLIVAAKLIGGAAYGYLLVLGQIGLTLYTGRLLFRLVHRLTQATIWAALALGFYLSSQTVLWDQCVLSDSLYCGLFNIVILHLLLGYLEQRRPGGLRLLGLGLLWVYSIGARDSGLYFTVIPCALLCLPSLAGGVSWPRQLAPLALFLVPLAIAGPAYIGWNAYRTGEPFFSVTGVANFLRPAFDLAKSGHARPFDDDSKVSTIIRTYGHDYDFPEQIVILQKLHDELGLTSPVQLLSIVQQKYVRTVLDHPVAYAGFVLDNMDPRSLAGLLFDPFDSFNSYFQLGVPPYLRVIPGIAPRSFSALARQGDYGLLLVAVAALIDKILSSVLLLGALAALLAQGFRAWRSGAPSRELKTAMLALCASVVVVGFFALVHSEDRLKLPIAPVLLAACAFGLSSAAKSRASRRAVARHEMS